MSDDLENASGTTVPTRRDFLRVSAVAALAAMALPGKASQAGGANNIAVMPNLPCGTLVIGGGNTAGMFDALQKKQLLPCKKDKDGNKTWEGLLAGKKAIAIGCGIGSIKASDKENGIAIEKWRKKLSELSKEKGEKFYRECGAKDVIYIKNAAYNQEYQAEIIAAINDPDTCFFDWEGGDQELIVKVLQKTPLIAAALMQRWWTDPNLLVYTNSASAAALSKHMMDSGHIKKGLGWLDMIIVDMHMLRKDDNDKIINRIPRLQEVVKECVVKDPDIVGIGVDEATALVLQRGYKVEDGKKIEQMTGTVVAAIDKEGKIRQGSVETNEHNVYVIEERDCDKEVENVPKFKPLMGGVSLPAMSIEPGRLSRLMKMPPGYFEKLWIPCRPTPRIIL